MKGFYPKSAVNFYWLPYLPSWTQLLNSKVWECQKIKAIYRSLWKMVEKGGGVERGITVSVALIQILTSDYSSVRIRFLCFARKT
jgi:hypothetical protein